MTSRGISCGGTTDHTVPEWATLGACEAAGRQLRRVDTITDQQVLRPHDFPVRPLMAETEVPVMYNRRARRAMKAIKKQIERAASKRRARRAA